jgi:hypothetical protein
MTPKKPNQIPNNSYVQLSLEGAAQFDVSDENKDSPYKSIPIPVAKTVTSANRERISRMLRIKSTRPSYMKYNRSKDEELFYRQAKFMQDYQDDYPKSVMFNISQPVYADMSIEQLRCYFTWRTKTRNAVIEKTQNAYVFLYAF